MANRWSVVWLGLVGLLGNAQGADIPSAAIDARIHEIQTKDGEVFRGTLIHADATRLVLRSKAAGELSFLTAEVVCLPPPLLDPAITPPAWAAAEAAPAPSLVPPASETVSSPTPAVGAWTRTVEAGYAFQSSTVSTRDVYARAEATYQASDTYRYNGFVKYIYGEQEGQKNADRLEGLVAMRHDLAKRWVFRVDAGYRNDLLVELDQESTGLGGVQYVLIDHPRFRLALGPGAGFRYRETESGILEGTRFSTDFVSETVWNLTDRLSLSHTGSWLYDTAEPDAYRVRNQAAFSARLSDHLRANVRYEHELDRARPVGTSRSDQRIFTTLGVDF